MTDTNNTYHKVILKRKIMSNATIAKTFKRQEREKNIGKNTFPYIIVKPFRYLKIPKNLQKVLRSKSKNQNIL